MPQYLSPGVYVEEQSSGAAPIAGAGTSTAGFIGLVTAEVTMPEQPGKFDGNGNPALYDLAPAGEPQLITSWTQFTTKFGTLNAKTRGNWILANAVYGFFNNGGTRCWVTRVESLLATPKDAVQAALAGFQAIDEISLVVVPLPTDLGATANAARRADIQGQVLAHCEGLQDRFAILDGAEETGDDFAPKKVYPNKDGSAMGKTSTYGAVYFPWIDVSGGPDFIPPSGHVAGVYARVDGSRGVHKAPANETIRGALGVKYSLTKAKQDGLNPTGLNVIRQFNGDIKIWGARTIGGNANGEWKYVNVRRLFLFLRESIDEGTQWVVFEPNAASLWAKVSRNVTAFLTNVWRAGALFGATPAEAFYVKCDDETNPPEVRDAGQLVTEIGVAVVQPAEFVVFRISQSSGSPDA